MKFKTKLLSVLFSALCLVMLIDVNHVFADTSSDTQVSENSIEIADKYVRVENNQYIFDESDAKKVLSDEDVKAIKQEIDDKNKQILNDKLKIDSETKEILPQRRLYRVAAHSKNYTTKNFWWGKRYYFTSNEAVTRGAKHFRKIANDRGNDSLFWSAVGDAVAYISPWYTLAANLASLGVQGVANRFNSAASALVAYNNKHRKQKIYLDFNFSCQYSLHVLK